MSEDWKPWLRRVAAAAIADMDVERDPAAATKVAMETARAAFQARLGALKVQG